MSTKISSKLHRSRRPIGSKVRRGDTIIEVMFAIAVFSLVAVITVSMMNLGTANAEGSLELATARSELNAQAEALRFVHSAYTAELALPACSYQVLQKNSDEKCQQYTELWEEITKQAKDLKTGDGGDLAQSRLLDITNTINNNDVRPNEYRGALGCQRVYEPGVTSDGKSLLTANHAFILNVRDLSISVKSDRTGLDNPKRAIILASSSSDNKFISAPLGARIVYSSGSDSTKTTDDGLAVRNHYNRVSKVEGIWVFAIKGEGSPVPFYDFYIQTCWNAPNSLSPTILDTVIRLYNPGAKS